MSTMTETNRATTQVYRVYIKAGPQAVWDAITRPEWTQRYGYGGSVVSDFRPGSPYRAYASEEMRALGAPEVVVDGEVLESDPPRKLVLDWRMRMDETMMAEGFTRLTYEIEPRDAGTRLTVVHELEGAPALANLLAGNLEDAGAGGGWSWVLSDLKTLLETGSRLAG